MIQILELHEETHHEVEVLIEVVMQVHEISEILQIDQ
jgi:hypothetical protein